MDILRGRTARSMAPPATQPLSPTPPLGSDYRFRTWCVRGCTCNQLQIICNQHTCDFRGAGRLQCCLPGWITPRIRITQMFGLLEPNLYTLGSDTTTALTRTWRPKTGTIWKNVQNFAHASLQVKASRFHDQSDSLDLRKKQKKVTDVDCHMFIFHT